MSSMSDHGTSGQTDAADRRSEAVAPERAGGTGVAPKEIGGPKGPEPTRFGDWERNGRCIDF